MSNPADSNPDQIREFAEATAFERYVLDLLVPAPSAIPRGSTTLRAGGHKDATVFADTLEIGRGSKKIAALQTQLLPVAFGAAWKVLDLLAELALNSAKATLSRSGSWTIAQKCRQVHDVTVAPFDEHRDVWAVIAASYSALVEARHALVHRRADVDDDTGELVYTDRHDAPQQRVTADEMKAFCYVARRAADAVRSGIITPRHLDDLRWQLDQLQAHHDQHPLGGARFVTPQRFQVSSPMPLTIDEPAPGHLKIDVEALRAQGPSVTHIDLEITCADGTVIHGELEHASKSIIRIDLSDPPKWITEVQPSPLSAT